MTTPSRRSHRRRVREPNATASVASSSASMMVSSEERHQEQEQQVQTAQHPQTQDLSIAPAAAAIASSATRRSSNINNYNNEVDVLLSYFAQQGPNWRARLRRRQSCVACATDLAQRLDAAADILLDTVQNHLLENTNDNRQGQQTNSGRRNRQGMTLPVTALAWMCMWRQPEPNNDNPAETMIDKTAQQQPPRRRSSQQQSTKTCNDDLLLPWKTNRRRRRQWQSLLQHLSTNLVQIRLVNEAWPDPATPRNQEMNVNNNNNNNNNNNHSPDTTTTTTPLPWDEEHSQRALAWLKAYQAWQVRPHVPLLAVWHTLQFVWLDGVPPEYVNVHASAASLQVLRMEKSALHTLDRLWPLPLQVEVREGEEKIATATPPVYNALQVSPTAEESLSFKQYPFAHLTHLKLVHCGLTHLTAQMQPQQQQTQNQSRRERLRRRPPPILPVYCPGLQTLCLAHNALTDQALTQAGLEQLVNLTTVDVSYNLLQGSWQTGGGNWSHLNVSHNQIVHIGRGLTTLYGLQSLDLSYNGLEQLSTVARLARLPLLQELRLEGNPIVRLVKPSSRMWRRDTAYEILWDLFRQARGGTGANDGFENNLGVVGDSLPTLDGRLPPVLTSRQNGVGSWWRRGRVAAAATQTSTITTPSTTNLPSPVPVLRQCPRRRVNAIPTDGVVAAETIRRGDIASTVASQGMSNSSSGNVDDPLSRMGRVGLVAATGPRLQLLAIGAEPSESSVLPAVEFTAWQVLQSLMVMSHVNDDEARQEEKGGKDDSVGSDDIAHEEMNMNGETKPSEHLVAEEKSYLPMVEDIAIDNVDEKSVPEDDPQVSFLKNIAETPVEIPDESDDAVESSANDGAETASRDATEPADPLPTGDEQTDCPKQETKDTVPNHSKVALEAETRDNDETMQVGILTEVSNATHDAASTDSLKPPSQTSEKTPKNDPNTAPQSQIALSSPNRKVFLQRGESSISAVSEDGNAPAKTPPTLRGAVLSSPIRPSDPSPSSLGAGSPIHTSFHVAFPDHVWQDETSSMAQDSAIVSYPDTASASEDVKVYELAESKSAFVGPHTYKALTIRENLELYFRMFVFSQALPNMTSSFLESSAAEEDWQSILELYPRIQLWPIDRRLRDATTTPDQMRAPQESFRRVWAENVVACGKPALRRLTPNLTARLGFHGELMWSSNAVHLRQEAVSTHRQVILCLSNSALYVILDHDAVTEKAKTQKRRFPLPLPTDACFAEAKWPHALARHPFTMLRKVIIGFGFQRVTLRFSNSSFPSPEDFTYVLLTCNKLTTVSLLKDLQEITNEAKKSSGFDELIIENDDPQVLDALGEAVAPDVVGIVYHYQVLEQRWKHGDKPNVRRAIIVTDTNAYLLDEDYMGDGAKKDTTNVAAEELGLPCFRLVDSAKLMQIKQLHTGADPRMITLVIRPPSRLSRVRNWRLVCRDREGKERLVEDVRKAISQSG